MKWHHTDKENISDLRKILAHEFRNTAQLTPNLYVPKAQFKDVRTNPP